MSVEMPMTLISGLRRYARSATGLIMSQFSGRGQAQDWGGAWWEYELDFAIHVQREGPRMSAFWASLSGPKVPFVLRDPSLQSSAPGAPVVSGGGQTGTSLTTSGWPASTTVLRAGDAVQIGTGSGMRLHLVLQDVVSGANGVATLILWPALRTSPVNGSAINATTPGVLLRLKEDVPVDIRSAGIHRFTVKAVEAL